MRKLCRVRCESGVGKNVIVFFTGNTEFVPQSVKCLMVLPNLVSIVNTVFVYFYIKDCMLVQRHAICFSLTFRSYD